jgi:hypothetical protein
MHTSQMASSLENGLREPIAREVASQRARTQESAQRLSLVAMRHWEKAVTGVIAVPAAAALTTAAAAMFAASLFERAFEMVEMSMVDIGRRVGEDLDGMGESRSAWRRADAERDRTSAS